MDEMESLEIKVNSCFDENYFKVSGCFTCREETVRCERII